MSVCRCVCVSVCLCVCVSLCLYVRASECECEVSHIECMWVDRVSAVTNQDFACVCVSVQVMFESGITHSKHVGGSCVCCHEP